MENDSRCRAMMDDEKRNCRPKRLLLFKSIVNQYGQLANNELRQKGFAQSWNDNNNTTDTTYTNESWVGGGGGSTAAQRRDDAVETVRGAIAAGKAAGGRKRGRRRRCCAQPARATEAWAPATARTCVVSSNSKSLLKKIFPKVFIGGSTKNSFSQNYVIPQYIPNKKLPNISKLTTSSRGPPCWATLPHTGSI